MKILRESPDLKKYLSLEKSETDLKRKRACWNSWIAPHNVEGFFLNMGDMLVKSGDYEKGIKIYSLIKQVPQYTSWEYKDLLEDRIANAKDNVSRFRSPVDKKVILKDENLLMVNSSIACMSCHKMSDQDLEFYKNFDFKKYTQTHNIYWNTNKKYIKE